MDELKHDTAVAGFLEKLKDRGLRLTAQREVLFRIIAENLGIPSTVQDIWGKTRALDPSIGIATVYRTINLLAEMGMVNVIYLNEGQFRLEMPEQKLHISAFCRHCGSLFPLGGEQEKQETLEQWILETGVELLPQSIAIAGLCEKCREDLKDENASPADQGPFGRPGHCPRRRRFRGGTPG
ncbi:MAG: Fur family transcriptional regulator [Synergistaceae bacterium]|nr:Fur family transcriptional regulator [Synergistaceae bacterium]MDD3391491.1 Fur family transcriptional regulator [Synergistaceae bacterium]MDD4021014.1 Fur family transcriptional regulator [Synergistaceae bacterium]